MPSLIPVHHCSSTADLQPCQTLEGAGSRYIPDLSEGQLIRMVQRLDAVGFTICRIMERSRRSTAGREAATAQRIPQESQDQFKFVKETVERYGVSDVSYLLNGYG